MNNGATTKSERRPLSDMHAIFARESGVAAHALPPHSKIVSAQTSAIRADPSQTGLFGPIQGCILYNRDAHPDMEAQETRPGFVENGQFRIILNLDRGAGGSYFDRPVNAPANNENERHLTEKLGT